MNCRDFLSVFEDQNALSETAAFHLNNCPNCQKTSSEQIRVWQMIDGLKRVEAPGNFDFHLKARIAKASAKDFEPRFFPVLRYVLPLSVIVLVFSLFVLKTVVLNGFNVPQVAETNVPASIEKENTLARIVPEITDLTNAAQSSIVGTAAPSNSNAGKQFKESVIKREEIVAAAVKSTKSQSVPTRKNSQDDFIGTRDFSLTKAPEKLPQGLSPNKKIETNPNTTNGKTFTAAEILSELGIETDLENGKRVVKAVKQKSAGEISSIKSGDIIEAIDGKKLTDEPASGKKIEGKTLTVTRGAEKIVIPIRNQIN